MVRRYSMDIIQLVTDVAADSGGETTPVVTIRINGRRLVDRIRDVESPFAQREGHAHLAGAYVSIPTMVAFSPSRHLLGEPAAGWDWERGAVPVLQCECAEPGCWPLLVCITVGSETVTWSDFRQSHRGPQSARAIGATTPCLTSPLIAASTSRPFVHSHPDDRFSLASGSPVKMVMTFARTCWPRTGYDEGNRSHVPVRGPEQGRVAQRLTLPAMAGRGVDGARGGIVVAADGSWRVAAAGMLFALSPSGDLRWSRALRDGRWTAPYHSAPLALDDGDVILTLAHHAVRYDGQGQLRARLRVADGLDDSGSTPNLTRDGALLTGSPIGDVYRLDADGWRSLGAFGYDIVPPTLYEDGSLAVAGYAGKGLCRLAPDGQLRWQAAPRHADLPVTVNRAQIAAVGSVNDHRSWFVEPDGRGLGEYGHAALFAEYPDGGWAALSSGRLARLTPDGQERWGRPLDVRLTWSTSQPIVDAAGRIYAATVGGVICYDGDGRLIFTSMLGPLQPYGLAMVAQGVLACLLGADLVALT